MRDVYSWMYLLHILGAVGLGFYLLLPFILMPVKPLKDSSKADFMSGLYKTSRIMQYLLVLQLLTGGYMMGGDYTPFWMTVSIGLLVFIGAISGIMNGRMKKAVKAWRDGGDGASLFKSVITMSWVTTISLIAILYYMTVHADYFK